MIHDCTNGELDKIKAFAREKHLVREFVSTFSRFKAQSKRGFDIYLYTDFAHYSLYFERKKITFSMETAVLSFTAFTTVAATVLLHLSLFPFILQQNYAGVSTLNF